ncbi:MAG: ATP-binding protein [Chitinispirillales bacterium]|nr:ATP-binding protein [Chitinispirillales bacterium]
MWNEYRKGRLIMPKKLPYGKSNFADLIESGYAYIDKTRFVELLENENNTYQFFIRPRRFGKSLFLSVLENYYDLSRRDKFDAIFGNLYIGKNPTPEQGTYTVLRFDFSGLDTDSREEFKHSFSIRVQESVNVFFDRYKGIFANVSEQLQSMREQKPGIGALDFAYRAAADANVPIFIIIDEYDHFANNLIALGGTYIKEVRAGGIVRAFYESLKKGTSSVVKRIFITGITPMMINLTSGFNMSTDYSLDAMYNEMFGFTSEEVEWLMQETGVDRNLIKVDMESYYNGYMFNNKGKNKVYNSQMILFLFNQISRSGEQPEHIVDTNLKTDYARLRRLAENKNNREILFNIVKDGGVFGNIVEKFSLDELSNENYFVSLLFYLGMLTNGGVKRGINWLKIPNYSIKTLYWSYAVAHVQDLDNTAMSTRKLSDVISQMAYDGDIKPYLDFFTENFLKRLSNRDLINFDEKYIKVMLLSTLFMSSFYLPVSEDEVTEGYTDIYLQRHPVKPDIKYEYVFEVKYVKTDAAAAEVEAKSAEARAQIEKYKKDTRFVNRDDVKFVVIVFKGKGDIEALEFF